MALLAACFMGLALPAAAEDTNSNQGLKLGLGLGSQKVRASENLEQGDVKALGLGYGFTERVTLWLDVGQSEHERAEHPDLEAGFVGIELGVEYKFRPHRRFRPYGRAGVGTYFLGSEGTTLNGNGVTGGLGADYRLARHFSVGAEFFWKDFRFTQEQAGEGGDFQEVDPPVPGNSNGFQLRFTLQM